MPSPGEPVIEPSRLLFAAMAMGAGALVLSCGDPMPVAPRADLPSPVFATSHSSPSGLLRCRSMAYDSVTAVIGPSGGDIKVSRHVLSIPGGTLKQRTTITAVAPSDTLNRIRFQPEGLAFTKPVVLVMSYANCSLDGSGPKEVVYTTSFG